MNQFSETKNLLVIVAMDVEEAAILEKLPRYEHQQLSQISDIKMKVARLNGNTSYIVRSGVGLVNAGTIVALAAEKLPISSVLLIGVAGAIKSELGVGDLIIADSIIQHDAIFTGEKGWELMTPGQRHLSLQPEERMPPEIPTNSDLSAKFQKLLEERNVKVLHGPILSGSEFVGSSVRKLELQSRIPNAYAVDMEAAGVAQIARKIGIPFAVVKTIADRVKPEGAVSTDYLSFLDIAARHASILMEGILAIWRKEK